MNGKAAMRKISGMAFTKIVILILVLITKTYVTTANNVQCEDRLGWKDSNNRTCDDIFNLTSDERIDACAKPDIIEGSTAFSACCGKCEFSIEAC